MARRLDWWDTYRQTVLVLYRGASDLAAKGVMFVIAVVAARQLSRDQFGLFALASTAGWLGAVAADFGIQVHLARSVSQQPARAASLLGRWLPVRIGTGVAALAVSLLVLRAINFGAEAMWPLLLFTLAYAATGLTECLYYFFRGLDRTDLESTLTLAQRSALLVLAVGALWWRPGVTLLGAAMLIPAVATLAVAALAARRLAVVQQTAYVVSLPDTRREFFTSVAPIGVGIILSALYFRVDVFLLERWSGTTQVALYNAVFRLVDGLRLFPAAVLAVALPTLCRASDSGPLRRLAAPLTAAALGVSVVLWFVAPWLVPALYGAAYADAAAPLRTLLLALPLMALNYALTHQLIGWHGHRAYASICGGALSCNLILNWQLIPALGMNGAAWATVWTEAVLTSGCIIALVQRMPIVPVTSAPTARPPLEAGP